MKIAFLSHLDMNLYLFRLPIMRELIKNGYTVYAVCPKGEYFDKFAKFGIKPISYEIERGSINPLKELLALRNIYNALKPLKVDILHTFTAKPNIYGSLIGYLLKIPRIFNSITGLGSFYIQETPKAKIVRYILEKLYFISFCIAHKVSFQNSEDMNLFIDKGLLGRDKAILIRGSGIDMDEFIPLEKDREREEITILMIARAIWDKGVKEYYEAANILKDQHIRFLYVGDIDAGNISSADIEFMKSGNVTYLGHRDDIKELMNEADIFVLPSYREGLPRTLLEASALKKAIITSDTTGCREVVEDGKNGILVPIKNSLLLSEAIKKLSDSKELREFYGNNAYEKCKQEFDVKFVVTKNIEMYES